MHRTRTSRRGAVAPVEADARPIDLSSSLEQRLAALFIPEPTRDPGASDEPREERGRRARG